MVEADNLIRLAHGTWRYETSRKTGLSPAGHMEVGLSHVVSFFFCFFSLLSALDQRQLSNLQLKQSSAFSRFFLGELTHFNRGF